MTHARKSRRNIALEFSEPIFTGPFARAFLDWRGARQRIYRKDGECRTSAWHLATRLANALDSAPDGACWEWQRARLPKGYGAIRVDGAPMYAHRLSYLLGVGPIPDGLFVLHRCDNPPCINPQHLFVGTCRDNALDSIEKGRASHPPLVKKFGEQNPQARLRAADIHDIRMRIACGDALKSIGESYGVSGSTIADIKYGNTWRDV
ncbi:HNH endonuclease signature motif containing protein [Achromobacter xylosoxidans]|jgi:hypothetical protein|uniref:HNH endonuclease signature motif containing protein n=2 Tax=Alcaligenes xylosoxydans xylosoxydans TaxID=85698 RepID=UPI00295480F2|nr:HNH endonuclease signature motif containing protein [Achromobacter xylosoxidans]